MSTSPSAADPTIGRDQLGQPGFMHRSVGWILVERRWKRLCAGLAAVVALLVYALRVPAGITGEDAGELALAAWYGSVAHPPGYVGWSLWSWLWLQVGHALGMILPHQTSSMASPEAWRVFEQSASWLALGSALTMAVAVYLTAQALAIRSPAAYTNPAIDRMQAVLAAIVALSVVGLSSWVIAHVVIIEVYALAMVACAAALRVWRSAIAIRKTEDPHERTTSQPSRGPAERPTDRRSERRLQAHLTWLAAGTGLGVGLHHMAIAIPFFLGIGILVRHPHLLRRWRTWWMALAAGLGTSLVMLALMAWRAHATADVSWLRLESLEGFLGFLLRAPYAEPDAMRFSLDDMLFVTNEFLRLGLAWPIGWLGLGCLVLVAAVQARRGLRRARSAPKASASAEASPNESARGSISHALWFGPCYEAVVAVVFVLVVLGFHKRGPSLDPSVVSNLAAFLLPLTLFVASGLAYGLHAVLLATASRTRIMVLPVIAIAVVGSAYAVVATPGGVTGTPSALAARYVDWVAEACPPNAVILVRNDAAFPLAFAAHGPKALQATVLFSHQVDRLVRDVRNHDEHARSAQLSFPERLAMRLDVISKLFPGRPLVVTSWEDANPPGWNLLPHGPLRLARRVDARGLAPVAPATLWGPAAEQFRRAMIDFDDGPGASARSIRPSWTDLDHLAIGTAAAVEGLNEGWSAEWETRVHCWVQLAHQTSIPITAALIRSERYEEVVRLLQPLMHHYQSVAEARLLWWWYGAALVECGEPELGFSYLEAYAEHESGDEIWRRLTLIAELHEWPAAERYRARATEAARQAQTSSSS